MKQSRHALVCRHETSSCELHVLHIYVDDWPRAYDDVPRQAVTTHGRIARQHVRGVAPTGGHAYMHTTYARPRRHASHGRVARQHARGVAPTGGHAYMHTT